METTDDSDRVKTILVLTDFTNSALNAADYALFLATELKANLLLFHSYYVPDRKSEYPGYTDSALSAEPSISNLKKERERLAGTIDTTGGFKPGIDYLSECGGIAENVCSIIDERKNILMLVMSGFKTRSNVDFLFGTEIASVVRKARCPAVIVPEVEFLRV